jgi:glucose-6-phosphate isomerase
MNVELEATRLALTGAGRSNMSLILPEISSFTIGQLLYMLEVQTVFTAGLYGVNPVDQPGVEAGKRHIYEILGTTDSNWYAGRRIKSTSSGKYLV